MRYLQLKSVKEILIKPLKSLGPRFHQWSVAQRCSIINKRLLDGNEEVLVLIDNFFKQCKIQPAQNIHLELMAPIAFERQLSQ